MSADIEQAATFETASRFLQRLAVPFSVAEDALAHFCERAQTVLALRSAFPNLALPGEPLTVQDGPDAEPWLQIKDMAISQVARLFPVEEDYMDELAAEGEPLRIYPAQAGFFWSWDDFDGLMHDPESWNDTVDLAAFFKVLWIMVDWDEAGGRQAWQVLQARFGWPGRCPEVGPVTAREFDFKHYTRLLKRAGLGLFDRIQDLALCGTGNLFLDVGPDEWETGMIEPFDYTRENITELAKQWGQARERLEEYERARELVAADPSIYEKLALLWERACRISQQRLRGSKRARPLVEIFGKEATENGLPDPLLAPV